MRTPEEGEREDQATREGAARTGNGHGGPGAGEPPEEGPGDGADGEAPSVAGAGDGEGVPPAAVGSARRWAVLAGLGYPVVALPLALSPLDLFDALWLAGLLQLLPLLAVAQAPLAREIERLDRTAAYLTSAATILILGGTSLVFALRRGSVAEAGLVLLPAGSMAAWTAGLVAAGLGVMGLFLLIGRVLGVDDTALLRDLLPRTPRERVLFAGLSFSAGFGEEAALRAYAIPALAVATGSLWGAAVLTSLSFGVLHAYQGALGMVRTAVVGLVLAASFLWTGSVLPAMAAHTVVDLLGGLVLGERLLGGTGGEPDGLSPP